MGETAVKLPAGVRTAVAISVDLDTAAVPLPSERGFAVDVGVPRLLALLRELDVVTTWPTSARDLVAHQPAVEAVLDEGHELAVHGFASLGDLPAYERVAGRAPAGFRAPERLFTAGTGRMLADAGFSWDSSLAGTEFEPYRVDGVLEIPASAYADDLACAFDHRPVFRRWRDTFDYAHQRVPAGVYSVTVHPHVIGRAHHIVAFEEFLRYLRGFADVWCATLSQVCHACSA
ncbi:hypothetical protein [Amycolatopsis sp. NPDC051903]|uniref:hypothetical protein n=1 Tax=Amycolatopsis sp. NPDC051903 TaxID=3363936 RepID=UPI003788CF4E